MSSRSIEQPAAAASTAAARGAETDIRIEQNRSGVTVADKDHMHHRLMRLGHGHRRSVLILWGWTLLLSAIALYPTYTSGSTDAYVPILLGAAALILYTMFGPGVRSRRDAD